MKDASLLCWVCWSQQKANKRVHKYITKRRKKAEGAFWLFSRSAGGVFKRSPPEKVLSFCVNDADAKRTATLTSCVCRWEDRPEPTGRGASLRPWRKLRSIRFIVLESKYSKGEAGNPNVALSNLFSFSHCLFVGVCLWVFGFWYVNRNIGPPGCSVVVVRLILSLRMRVWYGRASKGRASSFSPAAQPFMQVHVIF